MHRGFYVLTASVLAVLIVALSIALPQASGFGVTPTPTGQAEDEEDLGQVCRDTLEAWEALVPNEIPDHLMEEHPQRSPSDFDANTYFDVFERLSLPEGMVLDYVYYYDGMGGFPVLYTRPADQEPYPSEVELPGSEWPDFAQDIIIEDTPAGYVQFALFEMLAPQFYIFWHAGYGLRDVVCDEEMRDEMIEQVSSGEFGMAMEADDAASARKLDVTPVVRLDEKSETVTVEIVYFSHWGGFIREKMSIERATPRAPVETSQEVLVPYESGIMF